MTVNLIAHKQWATRPHDERYRSVEDIYYAALAMQESCVEGRPVPRAMLGSRLDVFGVDPVVNLPTFDKPIVFTNYGFGELCRLAGAPASYMSTLSPGTAVACLREGLLKGGGDATNLVPLVQVTDASASVYVGRTVRTTSYARVWDAEILKLLADFTSRNPHWKNPMAYAHRPGKVNGFYSYTSVLEPSGLFLSDRDMFAMLCDEEHPITLPDGRTMFRGLIFRNSEVGESAIWVLAFLYDLVCGNLIIHGFQMIHEIRLRHAGRDVLGQATREIATSALKLSQSSARPLESAIHRALALPMASDEDELVEVLGGRKFKFTEKLTRQVIETCKVEEPELNPLSVWGVVQGLTAVAREIPYQDQRRPLEQAAGRIFDIAWE